jgi:pantetheine-phosphate adenylyltransferase
MVKVCLGGTFDIIHRGHEVLLNKALDVGDSIIIGLTTDARAKKGRENEDINSYSQREASLYNWLKSNNAEKRVSIVPLDDDWGPGALEDDINSIVVSEETKSVAKKLNTHRIEAGMPKLEVIVVPMLDARDGSRISSSRIRRKEIDSAGFET